MQCELIEPIARAVLYEGYILYPYRPSVKNTQRWAFGGLYPPAFVAGPRAGTEASVVSPIPANGVGEIAYVVGGTRYTAPARMENGAAIGNGKLVTITQMVGTQFYVKANG